MNVLLLIDFVVGSSSFGRGRRKYYSNRNRSASYKRSSSPRTSHRDRFALWFGRDGGRGYVGGATAAAEAYVADYMRSMQHQLPPLPYVPPPGVYATPTTGSGSPYDGVPPPPPRYYDGLPLPPEYALPPPPPPPPPGHSSSHHHHHSSRSSSHYDKRSYDRSVDEFLWRTSDRSRDRDRDSHRSYHRDRR